MTAHCDLVRVISGSIPQLGLDYTCILLHILRRTWTFTAEFAQKVFNCEMFEDVHLTVRKL
jgi:hypothetical protein